MQMPSRTLSLPRAQKPFDPTTRNTAAAAAGEASATAAWRVFRCHLERQPLGGGHQRPGQLQRRDRDAGAGDRGPHHGAVDAGDDRARRVVMVRQVHPLQRRHAVHVVQGGFHQRRATTSAAVPARSGRGSAPPPCWCCCGQRRGGAGDGGIGRGVGDLGAHGLRHGARTRKAASATNAEQSTAECPTSTTVPQVMTVL
jgi:hypothetical protein